MRNGELRPGRFCVEDTIPPTEGFSGNEFWNGWAQPCFTFQVSLALLAAFVAAGGQGRYNEEVDTFEFVVAGEIEEYPGRGEREERLYPIGAGSWCWEEEE